ncbi:MAG: hypothetical protein ACRES6_09340 [Steroidobacteraceae bacterium]
MGSGLITKSGTDTDSIFAPWHSGWPQASATDFKTADGADLNARYAALSSGAQAAATEFIAPGGDLNAYFAALGSTGVIVATQPSNVSGSAAAGNPSGSVTSSAATCAGAKGSGSYTYTWHCTNCTATSPNSATTTFYNGAVSAGTTLDASAYCTIADGVTSVNTDAIAAALTNTTPATNIISGSFVVSVTSSGGSGVTQYTAALVSQSLSGASFASLESIVNSNNATATTTLGLTAPSNTVKGSFATINAGGDVVSSASGTYLYSGGQATWSWPSDLLADGQYTVTLSD